MQNRQTRWRLVLVLGLGLYACDGGSGSSGFDISSTESAAISQALATGRCVPVDDTELTVCPTDVTLPPGAPGSVITGLNPASAIPCSPSAVGTCTFTFSFMAQGLPPQAAYRIATRSSEPDAAWHLSAAPTLEPAPGAGSDFDVPVLVEQPTGAPAARTVIQLAVLVYLTEPSEIPGTVNTLTESGADFAYVVAPIDVSAVP